MVVFCRMVPRRLPGRRRGGVIRSIISQKCDEGKRRCL